MNNFDFISKDQIITIDLVDSTEVINLSKTEFVEFANENNITIASNGVMYSTKKEGFIPHLLAKWYKERKEYKDLMKKYKKENNDELTQLYHTKQLTQKVLLNSFYGVMALSAFRFYDMDNAEAITSTGQDVIKFSREVMNRKFNDKNVNNSFTVTYTDTDSIAKESMLRVGNSQISIHDLFEGYATKNGIDISDITGREFIFPKDLQLPYYDDNKVLLDDVHYIERHYTTKDMYEIETSDGRKIIVTEDHSCVILNDIGEIVEKTPLEMNEVDVVVTIKDSNLKYHKTNVKKITKLGKQTDYVYDIGMRGGNHTFFANDILVHNSFYFKLGNVTDKTDTVNLVKTIKTVDDYVNEKLIHFSKTVLNSDNNKLVFKPEKINYTSFNIAKKRYAMCSVWDEGYTYDEEGTKQADRIYDINGKFLGKLIVTGLDIIRSDFPPSFKEFMTTLIKRILAKFPKSNIDDFLLGFKINLSKIKLMDLMFPSGIGDIDKYNENRVRFKIKSGTPIHVKSSLYYNDLLDKFNLNEVEKIKNASKIKWCYLKENPYKLPSLAIKSSDDNPEMIVDYVTKYIDHEKMFNGKLEKKIQSFYDALKWGLMPDKYTKQINKLFKF